MENFEFATINATRPDLASLPVNMPEGYIAEKILPVSKVAVPSGTVYYCGAMSDGTAVTNRSVATAPSATQLASSYTTFTCGEIIDRGAITPDEAKIFGGVAKADEIGAKWVMKSVLKKREESVAEAILGDETEISGDAQFDPSTARVQIQEALDLIRPYDGKATLVAGTKVIKKIYQALLSDTPTRKELAGSGVIGSPYSLGLEAIKTVLINYLGIDDILIGSDDVWANDGNDTKFAIVKISDNADEMSYKYEAQLGRLFTFIPDENTNGWELFSFANAGTLNNEYTARMKVDAKILNDGAKVVFSINEGE